MQALGARPISAEAIREIKEEGNVVNIVVCVSMICVCVYRYRYGFVMDRRASSMYVCAGTAMPAWDRSAGGTNHPFHQKPTDGRHRRDVPLPRPRRPGPGSPWLHSGGLAERDGHCPGLPLQPHAGAWVCLCGGIASGPIRCVQTYATQAKHPNNPIQLNYLNTLNPITPPPQQKHPQPSTQT